MRLLFLWRLGCWPRVTLTGTWSTWTRPRWSCWLPCWLRMAFIILRAWWSVPRKSVAWRGWFKIFPTKHWVSCKFSLPIQWFGEWCIPPETPVLLPFLGPNWSHFFNGEPTSAKVCGRRCGAWRTLDTLASPAPRLHLFQCVHRCQKCWRLRAWDAGVKFWAKFPGKNGNISSRINSFSLEVL